MIISASRRTDIPAFYAEWFMGRIREGYCHVVNPYNQRQITRISLAPRDVEVIVFWTRNPEPLLPHLSELDDAGLPYYFLYTLLDYPPLLEPRSPPLRRKLLGFQRLAERVGAEKTIWRYDPIIFSSITDAAFHLEAFEKIIRVLSRHTRRCIISILDLYGKVKRRMGALYYRGLHLADGNALREEVNMLMPKLAQMAASHGILLQSCAEEYDLAPYGIPAGACIDGDLIRWITGSKASGRKDPSQRPLCRCLESRDIGAYDTCPHGCIYCYAVSSGKKLRRNRSRMQIDSSSLLFSG